MRKELEELKKERAAPQKPVYMQVPAKTSLSLPNLAFAALMLLIAGYLVGTIYSMDVAGSINGYIGGFSLPVGGDVIVAAIAVVLALLGTAIMTIVRK